jgi:hypothetical protein
LVIDIYPHEDERVPGLPYDDFSKISLSDICRTATPSRNRLQHTVTDHGGEVRSLEANNQAALCYRAIGLQGCSPAMIGDQIDSGEPPSAE